MGRKAKTVAELTAEQRALWLALCQSDEEPPNDHLLGGVVAWVVICIGLAVVAVRYGAF
jgi:hypothetical protein